MTGQDDHSLLLEASDVRAIVAHVGADALMDELVGRLTDAMARHDPAVAQVPPRGGFFYERPPDWGLLEWMPAHFGTEGTTVKIVGYHPSNPDRRAMPTVVSTICVFDADSGHMTGLLDGTFVTALRTGAASAVASRILADPGSRTLGVIGCGAQAVTQIHALSRLFPIERILAFDIREDVMLTLGARVALTGIPVHPVGADALPQLVAEADILCTCTSASPGEGPVFRDGRHRPHLHINAIGSDFRGKFEVPVTLLRRALVCPDFLAQAVDEGDCQQLDRSEIGPDLETLVKRPIDYVDARRGLTVFDSTGWALEDHVSALMMFQYARELGVGRHVAIECHSDDPKDPYSFLRAAAGADLAITAATRLPS